ncbi:MAG: addiction module protein [Methylacidiphilales bacterium]|nr:addiction module protein [Candidatus Methylacidiphilales bacterium]
MGSAIDLEQMTTVDKLCLMEALWKDLSHKEAVIASPEWHGDVLAERDRLVESGAESFIDWEVAKKKLREELQ